MLELVKLHYYQVPPLLAHAYVRTVTHLQHTILIILPPKCCTECPSRAEVLRMQAVVHVPNVNMCVNRHNCQNQNDTINIASFAADLEHNLSHQFTSLTRFSVWILAASVGL